MRFKQLILTSTFLLIGYVATGYATSVFINEIHYDNTSSDIGEGIEIAGPTGMDLSGWTAVLYNGTASNRGPYHTETLTGTFTNVTNGFGFLWFPIAGIQNGAPDGLALVDPGSNVIQFLSYEGIFVAASGAASGLTSADIGVHESSSTPAGYSLQLAGTGNQYEDFSWSSATLATPDAMNNGQAFTPLVQPVPEPGTVGLLIIGFLGLLFWRRK